MATATGVSVGLLRWVVFATNLFFWVAGLGTLAVALWLWFDPAVEDALALDDGLSHFYMAVYILLAIGILMTCLGFLGCCGAWRKNQCMLTAFFVLLVFVFALQLLCAIQAYVHQDEVKLYIEKSMFDAVHRKYSDSPAYTKILDKIQTRLECCGVRSYTDWLESYYSTRVKVNSEHPEIGIGASEIGRVPRSCCNDNGHLNYPNDCGESFDESGNKLTTYEPYLHTQGCAKKLYARFYDNLGWVIFIAVVVGILQLFGMVLSMLLCCCVGIRKKDERKHDRY